MAVYAGPDIVENGLVLCLDAANPRSYPGSGVTWFDISGNGNHFTLSGSLTFSSRDGFSGFSSTNKITRSSFPSNLFANQGGQGFTIMCWAKSNAANGQYQKIAGNGDNENYIDYYINPSGLFRIEADAIGFYNNSIFPANETLTASDGNWRMYGCRLFNSSASNPSVPFSIGNEGNATYDYPFNGNIAVVLLYNSVLDSDQITKNFNALRGRFNI